MNTDQATNSTPEAVCSTAGLGLAPERDARWVLAFEVARGRMAGGWVPVDADLVIALHDRLDSLAAEQRRLMDCRTCRNHTTSTGGCVSVLRCIDGSAYQRAGVRQCCDRA